MAQLVNLRYQGRTGQFFKPNGWETFSVSRPGRFWSDYLVKERVQTSTWQTPQPPNTNYVYDIEREMISWCSRYGDAWFLTWHNLGMATYWHFEDSVAATLFKATWDGAEWL